MNEQVGHPHELYEFLRQESESIAREYNRIRARAPEDPGTAGDEGENNWAALLRQWLPSYYFVRTKGRILSTTGQASRQVDVLVLKPSYPPALLDKKLYLAGGVAAAFECKNTVKAAHIRTAFENAAAIRQLAERMSGTPYRELHRPVVFGLLAHSHCWKQQNSDPVSNIGQAMLEADGAVVSQPSEMLDVLCVADLATWTASKELWRGPPHFAPPNAPITTYLRHLPSEQDRSKSPFRTPIAVFLADLFLRLAWQDPNIRPVAAYLRAVGLIRQSQGQIRKWPVEILSDHLRSQLSGASGGSWESWDEWRVLFPD